MAISSLTLHSVWSNVWPCPSRWWPCHSRSYQLLVKGIAANAGSVGVVSGVPGVPRIEKFVAVADTIASHGPTTPTYLIKSMLIVVWTNFFCFPDCSMFFSTYLQSKPTTPALLWTSRPNTFCPDLRSLLAVALFVCSSVTPGTRSPTKSAHAIHVPANVSLLQFARNKTN